MVKVIMGHAGAGKTKDIIELVKKAAEEESGNVICIEKSAELTYDIPYRVRLIDASAYGFAGVEFLEGFLSGLYASNFDVTHIFIDGLYSIIGDKSDATVEKFLDWCDAFGEKQNLRFTISMSSDAELATPGIKKYL